MEHCLRELVRDGDFHCKKDEWHVFLNAYVARFEISDEELNSIKTAFCLQIFYEIVSACETEQASIPRLITLLHVACSMDFTLVIHGFSPLERLLRQDPDGTYPAMTKSSQMQYLCAIKKEAKRRRVSPQQ